MASYHSKACRLTEVVQAEIRQGKLLDTPFFPSESQLAERYGASRCTIRRIIENLTGEGMLIRQGNGRLKINPDGFDRLTAAPEKKPSIAWAYAAYPDTMIVEVTSGITDYAEENGLDLQILSSATGHEEVLRSLAGARRLGLAGAIVLPHAMPEYPACLNRLVEEDFPVITIGPSPGSRCGSVGADDFGSVFKAVSELISRYDRPVYFVGSRETGSAIERYDAYCRAMQDAGFEQEIERCSLFLDMAGLNPKYWPIEQKLCHPAEMLEKVIDQLETPCSLFCMNDYIANGVYRAAGSRRIGIDIAVVGFGDLPLARRLSPPLSTLRVNQRLLGYQAAKLLHRRIRREFSDPVHLKLPTETVRRKSS